VTYHPLANDTGQTPERRTQEAQDLIGMLRPCMDDMTLKEQRFVNETIERFAEHGVRTIVSPKVLFWLRDLKTKYAE
jgi:hypothetical protein